MKRILIIGNGADDKYIGNSIRECKKIDEELQFDMFSVYDSSNCNYIDYLGTYTYTVRHFASFLYHIPKFRGLCMQRDIILSINRFVNYCINKGVVYDSVHIHYLRPELVAVLNGLKKISKSLILSPWGSDVLRVKTYAIHNLRKLAKAADIITAPLGSRFESDVKKILNISDEKLYDLGFGLTTVDAMLKFTGLTTEDAKKKLGIDNNYAIAIGYNASRGQHHMDVIRQILLIKNQLPENYILLLPFSYGGDAEYMVLVENLLKNHQLNYKLFKSYMSNEEVVYLRYATDLFIHAQDTDADSGTIREYLLSRKKIINPTWISYPHHEKYGSPFYAYSKFEELSNTILNALKAENSIISSLLVEDIKGCSWAVKAREWVKLYNK